MDLYEAVLLLLTNQSIEYCCSQDLQLSEHGLLFHSAGFEDEAKWLESFYAFSPFSDDDYDIAKLPYYIKISPSF